MCARRRENYWNGFINNKLKYTISLKFEKFVDSKEAFTFVFSHKKHVLIDYYFIYICFLVISVSLIKSSPFRSSPTYTQLSHCHTRKWIMEIIINCRYTCAYSYYRRRCHKHAQIYEYVPFARSHTKTLFVTSLINSRDFLIDYNSQRGY